MNKICRIPKNKPPILHEKAGLISYENCFKLGKIYKEIIGIRNIHHFSLNIVDLDGKLSILSYNPQIAYNIFNDGSYLYNGSISPDFYNNKDFYTWDETYDSNFYNVLKNNMERKNGINKGIVLIKRINGLTLLYSFATKFNGLDFTHELSENKPFFYELGDHCFNQISPILENYSICTSRESPQSIIQPSNVIKFQRKL